MLGKIGAALQGIGSVAEAFRGGDDFSKNDTYWAQNYGVKGQIRGTFSEARRQGVHPLWLMGAGIGSSPPVMSGQSNSGSGVTDALRGAGDALKGYANRKAVAAEEQRRYEYERGRLDAKTSAEIRALDAQKNRDESAGFRDRVEATRSDYDMRRQAWADVTANGGRKLNAQQDLLKLPNGSEWMTGASSKASVVQDHYGDIPEEAYGLWRMLKDADSNYERKHGKAPTRKSMKEIRRKHNDWKKRGFTTGGGY